jgi:hypothetical protein
MKGTFKFILDNGEIVYVSANTKAEAIRKYSMDTGAPTWWIKRHSRIVNQGKVEA